MSNSISQEITHTVGYLRRLTTNLDKLKDKTIKCFKNIKEVNGNLENYNFLIKETLKEYKKNMDEEFDFIDPEFALFMSDMSTINKSKHDDLVIYTLSEYSIFLTKYKRIKKHLTKDMVDPINDAYKQARYNADFTREVAYGDLLSYCKKIINLADRTVDKLKVTVGDKSIDDE